METSRIGSICVLLSVLVTVVWTYPTTVPATPEVCSAMTPGHGPSPQKGKSPFTLEVSTTAVKGGNNVQVTLDGNGHTFKGFYIQARDTNGARIGTFIPDDGIVKVHGCGGIKNNAAHHSGKDDKSSVLVHWKAPREYNGQVIFLATFVEEFESFWTNVKSEPVTISSFSELDINSHPNFTDSRKERATPKATQESRILNYNPYSPFSPLNNQELHSNEFLKPISHPDGLHETQSFDQPKFSKKASKRIRKSFYVPNPQIKSIDGNIIEDCRFHIHRHHQVSTIPSAGMGVLLHHGVSKIPDFSYATRYAYMRGQPPVSVLYSPVVTTQNIRNVHPTPGPVQGGFHYLDSTYEHRPPNGHHHGIVVPTRKVKFYDDSPVSQQSRPNYYPSSEILSSYNGHRRPSATDLSPGHSRNPNYVQPKPVYSGLNGGWSQPSHSSSGTQYGVIGNEYGVIDTAIVIPKNMEAYDLPKYGYLVYNPKLGPPFYIIPAETESFENAHFGLGRSSRKKQ